MNTNTRVVTVTDEDNCWSPQWTDCSPARSDVFSPQPRYVCLLHIFLSNIKGYPLPAVSRSALRMKMSFKRLWAQQGGGGQRKNTPFQADHMSLSSTLSLQGITTLSYCPSHSFLSLSLFTLICFPLITFLQTDLLLQCFIIACSFVLHLPVLGTDDNEQNM